MGKNLEINKKLESYIEHYSYNLHPVQKEIISYNESLGDIKKMQLAVSQCHFLEIIIKISNINKILEIYKRYIAYYLFLHIGFFYKSSQNNYIKNFIKFGKDTTVEINGFFDSKNNSDLIKIDEINKVNFFILIKLILVALLIIRKIGIL